jgi:hypothetical protein
MQGTTNQGGAMTQVERIAKKYQKKWGVAPTIPTLLKLINKEDLRDLTIKVDL